MSSTGPRNRITDIAGVSVGNATDARLASGVTVVLFDRAMTAAATVFGGGPGTRELDAVALDGSVGAADAIVLSGGSAFGLDAATGVQSFLRERGRGFAVGPARVPIVPQAILFDLLNGGDKNWGRHPPYRDLAYGAACSAGTGFDLGSAGAGFGATVARYGGTRMRGGLGSVSAVVEGVSAAVPVIVGALVAVNAVGGVTVGDCGHFLAAPYEREAEFGGRGWPYPWPADAFQPMLKIGSPSNTTLCIVATDAALSHAECKRLSIMAAAGLPRAIAPVFSPLDGDIVFAAATGTVALRDSATSLALLGTAAANCLTRAVARGVYEARGALPDGTPSHNDVFAKAAAVPVKERRT